MRGVGCGVADIEEEMMAYLDAIVMQGQEGQPCCRVRQVPAASVGRRRPASPRLGNRKDAKPPADHHGCGAYHPCPGEFRCSCERAGYCLRGQCAACIDRTCDAA